MANQCSTRAAGPKDQARRRERFPSVHREMAVGEGLPSSWHLSGEKTASPRRVIEGHILCSGRMLIPVEPCLPNPAAGQPLSPTVTPTPSPPVSLTPGKGAAGSWLG